MFYGMVLRIQAASDVYKRQDMAQGDRIPNDLTSYVSDNLRGEPGTTCVLKVERPTSDLSLIHIFPSMTGIIRSLTIKSIVSL